MKKKAKAAATKIKKEAKAEKKQLMLAADSKAAVKAEAGSSQPTAAVDGDPVLKAGGVEEVRSSERGVFLSFSFTSPIHY